MDRDPELSQPSTLGDRLARGDVHAFEQCYAQLSPPVLAYLRRLVGPDDAEDVLQRVFIEVWRTARRYDPAQSLSGWVFTIARCRAIDTLRARRAAAVPVDEVLDLVGEDGRDVAERQARAVDVRTALERLPRSQRVALELAYLQDRTHQDVAEALDVPVGTVKSRLARGGRALAALLDPAESAA